MERQGADGVKAIGIHQSSALFRVGNGKNLLTAVLLRTDIEAHGKGLLKKLRKPLGEIPALGNDPHSLCGEAVTKEQYAEALCYCTAVFG